MTKQELISRLIYDAEQTLSSRGYQFSDDAKNQLREFVSNGVLHTMTDADCNNTARIQIARTNLIEVCTYLCDKADRRNRIVENREFSSARFQICPKWPFC